MRLYKLSNIDLGVYKIESNLLVVVSVSGELHRLFGEFHGLPIIDFFIDAETSEVSNLPDDFDITEMLDIIGSISVDKNLIKNNKCNINVSLSQSASDKNLIILNINKDNEYHILLDRNNLSIINNEDTSKWKEIYSNSFNIEIV